MERYLGYLINIEGKLFKFRCHCFTHRMAQQIGVINYKGIDFSRLHCEDFTAVCKIAIKQFANDRIHIAVFHSDLHTDFTHLLMVHMTVIVGIQLFGNDDRIHICRSKIQGCSFTREGVTQNIGTKFKARCLQACLVLRLIRAGFEFFFKILCYREQSLFRIAVIRHHRSLFGGQGDAFILIFKEQGSCFQSPFAEAQLDTGGEFFIESVKITAIQQIFAVVVCLRHTANTPNSLNFKGFIHIVTEFYQNGGSRTVPARGNSLLDNNSDRGSIDFFNALQVFVHIREPHRKLTVFIGYALRFKPAFHIVLQFLRFVWNLHHDQRIDILSGRKKLRTDFTLLGIRLFQQIAGGVLHFHLLRKILINDEYFLDKSLGNNIRFRNFYNFRIFDTFRRGGATDNFVRMEILDDFIRLHRVVLMAFVHNDDKM